MQRRRLRILAMAVATVGLVMLGDLRPARADILVTVSASGTTTAFLGTSNTGFTTSPSLSIGGASGYTDVGVTVTTNYTGSAISSLSTGVTLAPNTTTPESLTVQVQLVTPVSPNTNNLLWLLPSSTPVLVSAGSSFAPQTGATSGTVATSTYFNSTSSTTTTGLTGTPVTSSTSIPGISPLNTSSMPNPSGTYTLSNILTLSNFTVSSSAVGVSFSYGGTSSVSSIPEPSSMAIAGIGALGMIGYGLRRRKALGA